MTGAMYAAISGLKTHMNKLNVIGNNIANVNTYGYKSARTTFQESLYTSVRSGSNGTSSVGGMNPAQLGYGCKVGTIDLDMSTKNYVPTGVNLDCMISGDGFFLAGGKGTLKTDPAPAAGTSVLNVTNASDLQLTRVGNFTFDSQGYLVDGYGSVIYGFVTCAGSRDATGAATQTDKAGATDENKPLVSTQLVPIRLPIAAKTADPTNHIDKVGSAIYPGVKDGLNVYPDGTTISANLDSISIDGKSGKITAVNNADGKTITVGYLPLAKVANPSGVTHLQGPYYSAGEGAGTCEPAAIGNSLSSFKLGLNNVKEGDTGCVTIFGTGTTEVVTNGLESSGTDIATEFSEMISTQRGYQANTRIITVTDSMLEELVNIKR